LVRGQFRSLLSSGTLNGMTTLREVHAAYDSAHRRARATSTVRLRRAERRLRHEGGRLTQVELAFLKAVRDELSDRGVEVAT